jgi:prepilin-type N-terminal cleavage/methylation domain-containing protein
MRQNGYTLIELLVVLVVMGLISAVSSEIAKQEIERFKMEGEIEKIVYTLRVARERALETGQTISVTPHDIANDRSGIIVSFHEKSSIPQFFSDGSCMGSSLRISYKKRTTVIHIDPIVCRISVR